MSGEMRPGRTVIGPFEVQPLEPRRLFSSVFFSSFDGQGILGNNPFALPAENLSLPQPASALPEQNLALPHESLALPVPRTELMPRLWNASKALEPSSEPGTIKPKTKKMPPSSVNSRTGKASSSNIDLILLFQRYVERPSAAGMVLLAERYFGRVFRFGLFGGIQFEHLRRGKAEQTRI